MGSRMKAIDIAIRSHTNLSMFEAIISLIESGSFYSGVGSDKSMKKIIAIAKKEQQHLISLYDDSLRKAQE